MLCVCVCVGRTDGNAMSNVTLAFLLRTNTLGGLKLSKNIRIRRIWSKCFCCQWSTIESNISNKNSWFQRNHCRWLLSAGKTPLLLVVNWNRVLLFRPQEHHKPRGLPIGFVDSLAYVTSACHSICRICRVSRVGNGKIKWILQFLMANLPEKHLHSETMIYNSLLFILNKLFYSSFVCSLSTLCLGEQTNPIIRNFYYHLVVKWQYKHII